MKSDTFPHDHEHISETEQIMADITNTANFINVADYFKQLADGNRLRIFLLLCHHEECVIKISTLMDMSSPAVSHHLRQLKSCGLITSQRSGKEMYYKAAQTAEAQLLHKTIENMLQITCPGDGIN